MNSRLPAHDAEHSFSLDLEDRFLDAAKRPLRIGDHLDSPAALLGEASVHPVEVSGKDSCFVAAGSGSDLDDCGAVVEGVVRYQCGLDTLLQLTDRSLEPGLLRAGFGSHVGVINKNELVNLRELVVVLAESGGHFHD